MSEFETKCGAGINVCIGFTPSAEGKDDWNIIEVGGEKLYDWPADKHYIGCGYLASNKLDLIKRCKRCVDNPNRGCDLSWRNWDNLDPQPPNI